MSGLNEIIQWTGDNINFVKGENPQETFEFIDKQFTKENRLPLPDILGDELPKYMEYIEEQTSTSRADMDLQELEQRASTLEQESRGIMKQVSKFLRGLFR